MSADRSYSELLRAVGISHVEVQEERFSDVVRRALQSAEVSDLPALPDLSDLLDDAREALGRAMWELNWAKDRAKKKDLAARLAEFAAALDTVAEILASTGRLRNMVDIDLLKLVSEEAAASDETPPQAMARYRDLRTAVEGVRKDVAMATGLLGKLDADGQPSLHGYDHVVALAMRIAKQVGVALTTGGNREDDQHATPFTLLVQGLDTFLPDLHRAKTLATCARRIERSASWRARAGGSDRAPDKT